MAGPDGSDTPPGVAGGSGVATDPTAGDEAAHREQLTAFLQTAPPQLAGWAARQLAAIDDQDHPGDDAHDTDDGADGGIHRRPTATRPRPARRSRLTPVLLALVGAGIVLGVYFLGDAPPAQPAAGVATAPAATIDEARVAELTRTATADPRNLAALRELSTIYYRAGDFAQSAEWQRRILAVAPDDVDARLALGVGLFNSGDLPGARENWERAAALAPEQAEVHYNLGFLYLSLDPPELDRARASWQRAIELDPDSTLARTAASHLQRLDDRGASGSPSPSANPEG